MTDCRCMPQFNRSGYASAYDSVRGTGYYFGACAHYCNTDDEKRLLDLKFLPVGGIHGLYKKEFHIQRR
jgi:hypothetical protein